MAPAARTLPYVCAPWKKCSVKLTALIEKQLIELLFCWVISSALEGSFFICPTVNITDLSLVENALADTAGLSTNAVTLAIKSPNMGGVAVRDYQPGNPRSDE